MLKYVGCCLGAGWEQAFVPLRMELEAAGVAVFGATREGTEFRRLTELERRELLCITDSIPAAEQACALGIACVGLMEPGEEFFFEGAGLVLTSLEGVDRRDLEEWFLRFHGRPVTIARTKHLVLREITAEDCPALYRISLEPGMELAREDEDGENSFLPERLAQYAAHVYRLFGYGLWSVILPDGTESSDANPGQGTDTGDGGRLAPGPVIGCCGFAPCGDGFEMEFMLSGPYRGRGYGAEMCRAALTYAADRLGAAWISIRIRRENTQALRFAEQLGTWGILPIRVICE